MMMPYTALFIRLLVSLLIALYGHFDNHYKAHKCTAVNLNQLTGLLYKIQTRVDKKGQWRVTDKPPLISPLIFIYSNPSQLIIILFLPYFYEINELML